MKLSCLTLLSPDLKKKHFLFGAHSYAFTSALYIDFVMALTASLKICSFVASDKPFPIILTEINP